MLYIEQLVQMEQFQTLFEENNIISLRTAYVMDDWNIVSFRLTPAWMESSIPKNKPKGYDWVSEDFAYVYRHMKSPKEEEELMQSIQRWQQTIRPMQFEKPPVFKLSWADSGNSVALYLNGEAWAFIDEQTHTGYSKGILKAPDMTPWRNLKEKPIHPMPWSQELFEKIFKIE